MPWEKEMKGIFVTGTDTGVGKTIITGYLAKYFLEKGYNVITQKWIQTGCTTGISADVKTHLKIMGKKIKDIKGYLPYVCPYTFKFAGSPHLASRMENKRIGRQKILKSFRFLSRCFDLVIVEGTGGALVPLDKKHLAIDIVKELNLAVLVVAQNKLGAINHTLLTIEALKKRKINISGIIFNNARCEKKQIIADNPQIIKTLTKVTVFGTFPWIIGLRKT